MGGELYSGIANISVIADYEECDPVSRDHLGFEVELSESVLRMIQLKWKGRLRKPNEANKVSIELPNGDVYSGFIKDARQEEVDGWLRFLPDGVEDD